MANKQTKFADLDDEARFEVTLNRPVRLGRIWARTDRTVEMKGRIVKEHADAVADLRPIAD